MTRALMMILACGGCVLNTNAPTEQALLDDGAIRVTPLRLTLEDGHETTVLNELVFRTPSPFESGENSLPFEYAGHSLSLEVGQVANMVAVGGEVGLTVDGDYSVVALRHRDSPDRPLGWESSARTETLQFQFMLEAGVVDATLELEADYHCPPFPNTPATPEHEGPPAVSGSPQ